MNLLNLSPLFFGAGLLALAGGLYLLQQLRIRYTRVPVATTIFWAEAVRDAPVRVFRQRFKHWLAWLLCVLICWLLWLGFADLRTDRSETADFYALILDGSAQSAVGDDFENSKQQILKDVRTYPNQQREVYFAGEHNFKLLAPDEDAKVLEQRLDNQTPVSARSSVEDQLRLIARDAVDADNQVHVVVYGRSVIPQEVLDDLPENVNVEQRLPTQDGEFSNRGIVALGVGEPLSGAWDRVDVLIRVLSTNAESVAASDLSITINDQAIASENLSSNNSSDFLLRDVSADGSQLSVSILGEDDLEFDDEASLVLPVRTQIPIFLGNNVPDSILPALNADTAIVVVPESEAEVAVLGPGDPASSLPTFRVVDESAQEQAFEIGYVGPQDVNSERALDRTIERLGLKHIDATAIAQEIEREITVRLHFGDQRFVSVWQPIVEDEFNFRESISFPLFISKSMRFLSDEAPWYAYMAAGKQAIEQSAGASLVDTDALSELAVGTYFVRNATGDFELSDELPGVISLLDKTTTVGGSSPSIGDATTSQSSPYPLWELITWLMLLALALVVTEWYIYQRRLMP